MIVFYLFIFYENKMHAHEIDTCKMILVPKIDRIRRMTQNRICPSLLCFPVSTKLVSLTIIF